MLLEWEKLYRNKALVLQAKPGIDTKARIDQITEGGGKPARHTFHTCCA
jgi:hypothetical protein